MTRRTPTFTRRSPVLAQLNQGERLRLAAKS